MQGQEETVPIKATPGSTAKITGCNEMKQKTGLICQEGEEAALTSTTKRPTVNITENKWT
jgi:hypothetical protein